MNAAIITRLPERIAAKIDFSGDCWEWNACKDVAGYGRVYSEGNGRLAHRVTYTLLVGPIPEGLVIDHLCRNPACVNPEHLEPVTDAVNLDRGMGRVIRRAATHCKHGHERTPENVYEHPDGSRCCRICRQAGRERYVQRELANVLAARRRELLADEDAEDWMAARGDAS